MPSYQIAHLLYIFTRPHHGYIDTDLGQYDTKRWVLMVVRFGSAECSSSHFVCNKCDRVLAVAQ